jgi:hypothetical protein
VVSRRNLKFDIVRVFAQRDEVVAMLAVPLTSTGDGSTTTIVDTALGRGTKGSGAYNGRMAEIVAAAHANINDVMGIDDAGFDGTSTLTGSPATGTALGNAAEYILYPRGLSPELVHTGIDNVLINTEGPWLYFPSLVTDSDLNAGNVTAWTDVGTPSTTTEFVATAANTLLGEGSIHVVCDAADEGFTSDSFNVTEQESLFVSVYVRVATGSCKVQLYNVTASTEIESVTVDEQAWTEVRFQDPVPNDCEQASIRLLSTAASDDFYMGAHCVVQSRSGHHYVAPSYFTRESQFEQAVYVPQGVASEDNLSYIALSRKLRAAPPPNFIRQDRGVNPFLIEMGNLGRYAPFAPIGLILYRPFDALSADTTSTAAEREYVVDKVVANILRRRGDGEWRQWEAWAKDLARTHGYGLRRVRVREPEKVLG